MPALVWLADDIGAGEALALAPVIFVPHLIQDDGRAPQLPTSGASRGRRRVEEPSVMAAVDQSFHILALFLTALLAAS